MMKLTASSKPEHPKSTLPALFDFCYACCIHPCLPDRENIQIGPFVLFSQIHANAALSMWSETVLALKQ